MLFQVNGNDFARVVGGVGQLQVQGVAVNGKAVNVGAALVAVKFGEAVVCGVIGHDGLGLAVQQFALVCPEGTVIALPVALVTAVGEPCGVYGVDVLAEGAVPAIQHPAFDIVEILAFQLLKLLGMLNIQFFLFHNYLIKPLMVPLLEL